MNSIETGKMMPREEVLSVVTPRPYEDSLSVERRAAEALNATNTPDHLQGLAASYDGKPTHKMGPQGWNTQERGSLHQVDPSRSDELVQEAEARGLEQKGEIVDIAAIERDNLSGPTVESHVTWGGR